MAISIASKSIRPVLQCSENMSCIEMLYFTGDFLLMVSAVFSLRRQCVLDGASAADLLVDFQQLLRQPTKAVTGLHLSLRLEPFGRGGKCFGDGLSVLFTG
jgi:hypothetical protein